MGELLRGKWRVLERLGAGSYGTVYRVQDENGGWIEALKILGVDRTSGADADNIRERFLREAQIMKRLGARSRHIVGLSTYEEDLESGLAYFLMELVEGRSLGEVVAEEGPLGVDRTLRLALQICDALIVAHEDPEEVVHRDLKLENIMLAVDQSGEEIAKVLDFGIAKVAGREADSRLTAAGTLGTPGYAAPEQLRAEEVDPRTDLFALGVILYALLTGRDPWLGNPAGEATHQIYELMVATERGEARPFVESDEVPPALVNLVMRLLRRDPEDRFGSARELKVALERISRGGAALEEGSLRVLTDPPGVEIVIHSGRRLVERGPTPRSASALAPGTYRIRVRDPRFEPLGTTVVLAPGAAEDVTIVATARSGRPAAIARRYSRAVTVAAIVALLLTASFVVRPWGRILDLSELHGLADAERVATVRLSERGIEGRLTVAGIPAPFRVPIDEDDLAGAVAELRSAGISVDTSREIARLVRLAAGAQAELRYFGVPGRDVRGFAERAAALEPESAAARSLLLKVARRMAWDAEAALDEGSSERARQLFLECLEVVPDHAPCFAADREG